MQEIYAGAEQVVIWLGEASLDSDIAIAFMKQLCECLEKTGVYSAESTIFVRYEKKDIEAGLEKFLARKFEDKWEAVAGLLLRPWWERAWVVQELVAARAAICCCGNALIAWPLVSLTIELVGTRELSIAQYSHYFRSSGALDRAWGIAQLRYEYQKRGHIDIWTLLHRNRLRFCADPRDKVYSVLGMTNKKIRLNLVADYTKSVAQVLTIAVVAYIENDRDLDVLNLVDHDSEWFPYPSWVADLGRSSRIWRLTHLVPDSSPYKSAPFLPPTFSNDLQLLHADCFLVDVIEEDNVQQTGMAFERRTNTVLDDWTWNINRMTARLIKEGGIRLKNGIRDIKTPENHRRSVESAIYDVMIAGQLGGTLSGWSGWVAHEVRYPDDLVSEVARPMDQEIIDSQAFSQAANGKERDQNKNKPIDWENMLWQASSQTLRRTLILSKGRYLGLAPALTKPGDQIFILFGLHEPAILRPQADSTYVFIGTAYVHGIMKGEALKDLDAGIFKRERMTIR
jgi:hypothetical protein